MSEERKKPGMVLVSVISEQGTLAERTVGHADKTVVIVVGGLVMIEVDVDVEKLCVVSSSVLVKVGNVAHDCDMLLVDLRSAPGQGTNGQRHPRKGPDESGYQEKQQ